MAKQTQGAERMQLELKETLECAEGCSVVGVQSRNGDLRALFRVKDENKWLPLLAAILHDTADKDWYVFLGKKYMLHDGKLLTAWILMLDAPPGGSIATVVEEFRAVVLGAIDDLDPEAVYKKKHAEEIVTAAMPWKVGNKKVMSRIRALSPGAGE